MERTRKEIERVESQAAKDKTELQAALDAQVEAAGQRSDELRTAQEKIQQLETEKLTSESRWNFVRRWVLFPSVLIILSTILMAYLLPTTISLGN